VQQTNCHPFRRCRWLFVHTFSDLPGVWREIPEGTAVTVRPGGVLEERPFRPRAPDPPVDGPGLATALDA
jgi:hypothetical protein